MDPRPVWPAQPPPPVSRAPEGPLFSPVFGTPREEAMAEKLAAK